MPSLKAIIGADASSFNRELVAAGRMAEQFGKRFKQSVVTDDFTSGSGLMKMLGAVTGKLSAGYAAFRFVEGAIDADVQIQRVVNTLTAASKSADQAARDFAYLKDESNRIGFSLLENANAFARFSVAARAASMSSEQTRKIFTSVQESAAVMGLTTDQTASVMLALEQMMSKGTVMSQELRLQLGNAMPGAMDTFARALGVTQQKLYQMVEAGQVVSKDALPKFAEQLSKDFKLEDEANKTLRDINRMKNAWLEFKAEVGQTMRPATNLGLESVTKALVGWRELLSGNMNLWASMYKIEEAAQRGRGASLDQQLAALNETKRIVEDGFIFKPVKFMDSEEDKKRQADDVVKRRNDAVNLDKSTDEIREDIRIKGLTKGLQFEARISALVKERTQNEKNIADLKDRQDKYGQENTLDIAMYKNKNAKIDRDIFNLKEDKKSQSKERGSAPDANSMQRIGLMAVGDSQMIDYARRQLEATMRVERAIRESGRGVTY